MSQNDQRRRNLGPRVLGSDVINRTEKNFEVSNRRLAQASGMNRNMNPISNDKKYA